MRSLKSTGMAAAAGIFLIAVAVLFSRNEIRVIERFSPIADSEKNIPGWEERSFVGHTRYSVVREGENYVLHAFSDSTASGLYYKVKYDPEEWPLLSWRWKVVRLPEEGDVHSKETDDYGARVYVVFPRFLKWKTKTINYIWSNRLPKGESIPNSWLPNNAVMIAVQSGTDSLGRWITETRNVFEDYRRIFGSDPPKVGAIAVMSDGDNTGDIAEAFYDDFILLKDRRKRE
jgi:hypothetical protein